MKLSRRRPSKLYAHTVWDHAAHPASTVRKTSTWRPRQTLLRTWAQQLASCTHRPSRPSRAWSRRFRNEEISSLRIRRLVMLSGRASRYRGARCGGMNTMIWRIWRRCSRGSQRSRRRSRWRGDLLSQRGCLRMWGIWWICLSWYGISIYLNCSP